MLTNKEIAELIASAKNGTESAKGVVTSWASRFPTEATLSDKCGTCEYFECSYCGSCHNPDCSAYRRSCR